MSSVHTLYFIHHSHTDVGYTHDQPVVFDLHGRFLDEALRLADKYSDREGDGAFRWTVETTFVLYRWLQQASAGQIERFKALEHAGRIEVTGMFANLTPLLDTDQLVETFQLLRPLRDDFGFTIRHAMNCDVNGENWPLVDLLLDLGIEGFSMAINTHFGGAPMQRPNAFWWEGPSGRKILAYNGWPYDTGWRFRIGRDAVTFEETWWPRVERRLAEIDYPLPVLMVQSFHPFGDNGSAYEPFSRFIDAWNEQGKSPRLVMATPKDWWAAVKAHSDLLSSYRGDWTDYWNFGCISSAREQALNRASRARLRAADALAAAVVGRSDSPAESTTARSIARYREAAWHSLHLWDEHTWGADCSIRAPGAEDTAAQWYHKASYAYTARSLSLLLQRDGLAGLGGHVQRTKPDDLLVFNPLPWPRRVAGIVPQEVASPRGLPEDVTAGRHFQDRMTYDHSQLAASVGGAPSQKQLWLKPVKVPGFGYTVIPRADLVEWEQTAEFSEEAVVENDSFRLTFDQQRGGILSWHDKALDHEWVDQSAGYPFNGFVHEQVADASHVWPRNLMFYMEWLSDEVERSRGWKPEWPVERRQPSRVIQHGVYRTPLGYYVIQSLEAPGCAGPLKQSVFLPDSADYIECESWWDMGLNVHPEATYMLYPFNMLGATARLDLGGQPITVGSDQLPGVCLDYFTVQGWVDLSNEEFGVTVAMPENPMIQLGNFHFAHNQAECTLERAMLLGWVTNNYWETNFRAHQPGRVHTRYRIKPHRGGFNELQAHHFGLEAAYVEPLFQHLGEPEHHPPLLPEAGALLRMPESFSPESPILTMHVKAAERRPGVILRLFNASDQDQPAEIGSGFLRILSAQWCDLLETPQGSIEVQNGTVTLKLPARRVTAVLLNVEASALE
jgi:alpha-mannosidase